MLDIKIQIIEKKEREKNASARSQMRNHLKLLPINQCLGCRDNLIPMNTQIKPGTLYGLYISIYKHKDMELQRLKLLKQVITVGTRVELFFLHLPKKWLAQLINDPKMICNKNFFSSKLYNQIVKSVEIFWNSQLILKMDKRRLFKVY